MARLDGGDCCSDQLVGRVGDGAQSAKVGGNSDTFKQTCGSQEAGHVGDSRKVVCARLQRIVAQSELKQGDV